MELGYNICTLRQRRWHAIFENYISLRPQRSADVTQRLRPLPLTRLHAGEQSPGERPLVTLHHRCARLCIQPGHLKPECPRNSALLDRRSRSQASLLLSAEEMRIHALGDLPALRFLTMYRMRRGE